MYKKLKNTHPDSPEHSAFKVNHQRSNDILKKTIRDQKKKYYSSRFEKYKNDIRKTWKTINEVLNRTKKKKMFPEYFQDGNTTITDKLEIANKFNIFFTNIGPELANKIKAPKNKNFKRYLKKKFTKQLKFKQTNETEVKKIIESLQPKNSSGFDGISMKLIKKLKTILITPLTLIINQSLKSGIFPNKLKIAKVNPIYKKDDETLFTNYRPISLLPVISKIFERIIYNQVFEFFTKNKLFFKNQYGFRKGHSTEFATLEIIDRIICKMDKNETPINVYLDLSKAFDTLDHDILLEKLHYYGIRDTSLQLFQSYLSSRKQYVEFDGTDSEMRDIRTGVPQGSILGPLLFIIYINDLNTVSTLFKFIIYADDTSLSGFLTSFGTNLNINQNINQELQLISEWLKINKLSLNVGKTKFMIFYKGNKRIPNIKLNIDGTEIERVQNFNFLGVILNEKLSWKPHTDKVANCISKTVGILNALKHFIPESPKVILYNSLILSHFNYGILAWGYEFDRLTKLQKKSVRIITLSKYNAHTEPLFKRLKLLKLSDLLRLNELKFYYKYVNQTVPEYFSSNNSDFNLLTNNSIHEYNTRQGNKLHTERTKHKYADKCIRHSIPKTVNSTSNNILDKINTHSMQGFSKYIKNIYIENYNITCAIQNCYICNTTA